METSIVKKEDRERILKARREFESSLSPVPTREEVDKAEKLIIEKIEGLDYISVYNDGEKIIVESKDLFFYEKVPINIGSVSVVVKVMV